MVEFRKTVGCPITLVVVLISISAGNHGLIQRVFRNFMQDREGERERERERERKRERERDKQTDKQTDVLTFYITNNGGFVLPRGGGGGGETNF